MSDGAPNLPLYPSLITHYLFSISHYPFPYPPRSHYQQRRADERDRISGAAQRRLAETDFEGVLAGGNFHCQQSLWPVGQRRGRRAIYAHLPAGEVVPAETRAESDRRFQRHLRGVQGLFFRQQLRPFRQGGRIQPWNEVIVLSGGGVERQQLVAGAFLHPDGQIVAGRGGAQAAGLALDADESGRRERWLRASVGGKEPGEGKQAYCRQREWQAPGSGTGKPLQLDASQDCQSQADRSQKAPGELHEAEQRQFFPQGR
ncbi:MAG: hypothetical protein BWY25_02738 [Chloroflexi bacterium ADurb.Bin222]|nr:MAG: hypothetical protein BWY25_02738 [Chloroflexi bacterium ADurb.Bin222]